VAFGNGPGSEMIVFRGEGQSIDGRGGERRAGRDLAALVTDWSSRATSRCGDKRRLRAESAPIGVASGRTGVRALAVVPMRARNRLHRPIKRPAAACGARLNSEWPWSYSGNPALHMPSARRSRQARWAGESLYLTVRNQPTVNLGSIASPV
jgi:hypothetical protein